jgi:hypothetical protein
MGKPGFNIWIGLKRRVNSDRVYGTSFTGGVQVAVEDRRRRSPG